MEVDREENEDNENGQEALAQLIRLQELHLHLAGLRSRIAAAPAQMAELDRRQEERKRRVAQAEQSLEQSARDRRRLEGEVDSLRAKLSHLKGQLMEVKTNEAYQAMLKEIAYVETQIRAKEDEILDHMALSEELEGTLRSEQADLVSHTRQLEQEKLQLEVSLVEAEQEVARLEAELHSLQAQIAPNYLERFRRIAAARGGIALATISNGSCEACHVRLRPQLIAEVRANRDIILCENCNRILYYAPAPTA